MIIMMKMTQKIGNDIRNGNEILINIQSTGL